MNLCEPSSSGDESDLDPTPRSELEVVLVEHGDLAVPELVRADENPAVVYLASLSTRSRPTMGYGLKAVVRILSSGKSDDYIAFRWATVRVQHMQFLRSRLIDREEAPGNANKIMVAARCVMRECFNLGLITHEDYIRLKDVKAIKGERLPVGRMIENHEMRALYDATDPLTVVGIRDRGVLTALENGAFRRLEVATVTLERWHRDESTFVVIGKGNKERSIHINEVAREHLDTWVGVRGEHAGPLFHPIRRGGKIDTSRGISTSTVYGMMDYLSTRAGLEKPATPHDMRRTFISNLFDLGVDIATIADIVGHAQVGTTRLYDRRGEKTKKMAAQVFATRSGRR